MNLHDAMMVAMSKDDSGLGYDKLADIEKEGVLGAVIKQRARLLMLSDMCHATGDVGGAIAAEAALARNLTLAARVVGRFAATQVQHSHQHVMLSADYMAFRKRLLEALRSIPAEHAQTIAAALHATEEQAALQIAPPKAPEVDTIEADFVEVAPPCPISMPDLPPCPVPLPT